MARGIWTILAEIWRDALPCRLGLQRGQWCPSPSPSQELHLSPLSLAPLPPLPPALGSPRTVPPALRLLHSPPHTAHHVEKHTASRQTCSVRFHFRVVRDSDVFEDCDAEARVGGRWGQGHNVMASLSSEHPATMHIHHSRCSGIASVDHYDSNSTSDTAAGAACGLQSTQVARTYVGWRCWGRCVA